MTYCTQCSAILGPGSKELCNRCRPREHQRRPPKAWKFGKVVECEHTETASHYREGSLRFGRRATRVYTKGEKLIKANQMRMNPTRGEAKMANILRKHYGNRPWTPQVLLHGFIVDFLLPDERIVIEVDGSVHDRPDVAAWDKVKQDALERNGYLVVRVTNNEARCSEGIVRRKLDVALEKAMRRNAGKRAK